MSVDASYFDNHQRVRRFPWSVYHGPLEASLSEFLASVRPDPSASSPAGPHVLVIGGGLLQELDVAPDTCRFTVVDIDARAIERARALGDARIAAAHVVRTDQDLSELGRFDGAYAKEVIEHIPTYSTYLMSLRRALRPGGRLWLSTPNYGEPWLPAIEYTFLEWVARVGGYTRFGIHPAKFSRARLERALESAGFVHVEARTVALRLALVATAEAPSVAA